jgi:polysaccharide export outer membrane protein
VSCLARHCSSCFSGRFSLACALAAALLLSAGCASVGRYVWVDDFKEPAADTDYVIAAGDLLSVRVYGQEAMSGRARVRSDGRISLPFLDDVEAAGLSPPVLAQQLQTRLKDVIKLPVVTVAVEEPRPRTISVLGEVTRPGLYPLEPGAGALQALASAGGLTEFAKRDRIFILRRAAETLRIRMRFEALARAEGSAPTFRLQPGDVVVVE